MAKPDEESVGSEDSEEERLIDEEQKDREARDVQGLQPEGPKTKTEAQARSFYCILIGTTYVIGQILAWGLYLGLSFGLPQQKARYHDRFQFIYDYELGWVYLVVAILSLGRSYMIVNANGARAGARVDRPDQHVYKIMAGTGEFASPNAPFVMMVNTGAGGRFNRAQRAVGNMDETLPLVSISAVLTAAVFDRVIVVLVAFNALGRVVFANGYTRGVAGRGAGFAMSALSEICIAGLVILCAIKGLAGPAISV